MRYLAILIFSCSAWAQFSSTASHIRPVSTLPAACRPGTGDVIFLTTGTVGVYECTATNTWKQLSPLDSTGSLSLGGTAFPTGYPNGTLAAACLYSPKFWVPANCYGATGSGDNTAAVHRALTAAQASGGTLYFPSGTYDVSDQLLFDGTAALNVYCDTATLRYTGVAAIRFVELRGAQFVRFRGCSIASATRSVATGLSFRRPNNSYGYPNRRNVFETGSISGFAIGIENSVSGEGQVSENSIIDVQITNCTVHVSQKDASADVMLYQNVITSDFNAVDGDTFYDMANGSANFVGITTGSGAVADAITQIKLNSMRNVAFDHAHLELYNPSTTSKFIAVTGNSWITFNGGYVGDFRVGALNVDVIFDFSLGTNTYVQMNNTVFYRAGAAAKITFPNPYVSTVRFYKIGGNYPNINFLGPTGTFETNVYDPSAPVITGSVNRVGTGNAGFKVTTYANSIDTWAHGVSDSGGCYHISEGVDTGNPMMAVCARIVALGHNWNATLGATSTVDIKDNTTTTGATAVIVRPGPSQTASTQLLTMGGGLTFSPVLFANLGTVPAAGGTLYCTDCVTAAVCLGVGTGHLAVSNGTNWVCN